MGAWIRAISYYLPGETLTNEALAAAFPGWDVDKVYNKVYCNDIPGLLEIDVPEQALDPGITVLAILLDGPVKLYKGAGQVITAN